MKKAKTHAAHQREYRRRQLARGLCELKLWCRPEHRARIREFATDLTHWDLAYLERIEDSQP